MIQSFMDIIILQHLKNNNPMSGYDIIRYLHKKFHMLLSPGTVYSILYTLERQNLIEGSTNQRKRVYKLTEQGEKLLRQVQVTREHIYAVFSSVFSEV